MTPEADLPVRPRDGGDVRGGIGACVDHVVEEADAEVGQLLEPIPVYLPSFTSLERLIDPRQHDS